MRGRKKAKAKARAKSTARSGALLRERGLGVRNRIAVERGIMERYNCREVALHHAMATLHRGRCIALSSGGQDRKNAEGLVRGQSRYESQAPTDPRPSMCTAAWCARSIQQMLTGISSAGPSEGALPHETPQAASVAQCLCGEEVSTIPHYGATSEGLGLLPLHDI
jgi:hypothetical protein